LRYFPSPKPPSLEKTQRFVMAQINHWKEHGFGWWAVELRNKPGIIGWNGLQYLPETDEIEIGYLLGKAYWGKGLATEGGQPGLVFGFEQLALDEIIAVVHPENIPSQKVIQKLGLKFTDETDYFGMQVYRYALDAKTYYNLKK